MDVNNKADYREMLKKLHSANLNPGTTKIYVDMKQVKSSLPLAILRMRTLECPTWMPVARYVNQ
jgi:hypothetical protein